MIKSYSKTISGVKDNQGWGKISREILPPRGQAVQGWGGGKINYYTGVTPAAVLIYV